MAWHGMPGAARWGGTARPCDASRLAQHASAARRAWCGTLARLVRHGRATRHAWRGTLARMVLHGRATRRAWCGTARLARHGAACWRVWRGTLARLVSCLPIHLLTYLAMRFHTKQMVHGPDICSTSPLAMDSPRSRSESNLKSDLLCMLMRMKKREERY